MAEQGRAVWWGYSGASYARHHEQFNIIQSERGQIVEHAWQVNYDSIEGQGQSRAWAGACR